MMRIRVVALVVILLPASSGFVSAQTPAPATPTQTASTPTAQPATPAPVTTPTATVAAGRLTVSPSSGAVGDVVIVHGEGFTANTSVIFVCSPSSLPGREFAATVAQPAGVSFNIPFTIPAQLG